VGAQPPRRTSGTAAAVRGATSALAPLAGASSASSALHVRAAGLCVRPAPGLLVRADCGLCVRPAPGLLIPAATSLDASALPGRSVPAAASPWLVLDRSA
jgi:hypothetical protein